MYNGSKENDIGWKGQGIIYSLQLAMHVLLQNIVTTSTVNIHQQIKTSMASCSYQVLFTWYTLHRTNKVCEVRERDKIKRFE